MINSYNWIVMLLMTCVAMQFAVADDEHVDTCVANYCLGKKEINYSRIKSVLGAGSPVVLDGNQQRLCYFDTQQKLWLLLEFSSHAFDRKVLLETIFVSNEQICTQKISPLSSIQDLRTTSGIRVGMTEMALIELKGQPERIDNSVDREMKSRISYANTLYASRFGERVLVYLSNDQSKFNFFYITSGKVKSIWVSNAE